MKLAARQRILSALKQLPPTTAIYAVEELQALQLEQIKTVIADPVSNRRLDKLEPEQRPAGQAALRSTRSKYGKALLRRRGMHIERSFAHISDRGWMRRATLRGWENLNKRFKLAAAFYNLSQLMRKLFGFGTPKQLAALARAAFSLLSDLLSLIAVATKNLALNYSLEPPERPTAALD